MNNTSTQTIFNTTRFCNLWRFYYPIMRGKLALAAGFTALCYALTLTSLYFIPVEISAIFMSIPIYAYFAGALVFGLIDDYNLDLTLPATWFEKGLVALLYIFVVSPAVIAAAWYGSQLIALPFFAKATLCELYGLASKVQGFSSLQNLFGYSIFTNGLMHMILAGIMLLTVILSRTHRVAKGIAAIAVCYGVQMLAGIFFGMFVGVKAATLAAEGIAKEEIVDMIVTKFVSSFPYMIIVLVVLWLVLMALIFNAYRTRKG